MTAKEFGRLWRDDNDYVEVMTSGSTGMPKVIRLSKKDMQLSALATNNFFGINSHSRLVCPMDFRYIGARMMLVRAEMAGAELVSLPPSNTFNFDGKADLLAIVPSQVDCLLENPDLLSRVSNLIIGGAPLDGNRVNRLLEAHVNAYSTYGMTETASHVALAPIGSDTYIALSGVTFSVDSRDCLIIGMEGRSVPHIITNDLVNLVSDTQFKWKGRFDNVINSGGIKIHPELIERHALSIYSDKGFSDVTVVVVGVPSEKWGEQAVMLVESDSPIPDIAPELRNSLSDPRTAPKQIVRVDKIPHLASGKIDRTKCCSLFLKNIG